MTSQAPASEDRALRFNLNVQKNRAVVYTLAVAVTFVGWAFGHVQMSYASAIGFLLVSTLSALLFHRLYSSGVDRRLGVDLKPFWMAADVALITLAVYLTGAATDWYVWYLANTGAAAFVSGGRAAVVVALANTAAYAGVLALMQRFDASALVHMVYLYGASFFLLRGIARLKQSRQTIKRLQEEQGQRVQELTRLAQELDAANARLIEATLTDALTGLHNRRFLEENIVDDVEQVRRAYGDARRGRAPNPLNRDLGCLLVDIDHFKRINDTHGHDAGDAVLRETARRLRGAMRANDALVRLGGEEFLFLLRKVNRAFLPQLAERLLQSVSASPQELPYGRGTIQVTCSIGWSCYPLNPEELDSFGWEDVLKLADTALYLAKHNGRAMAVGLVAGDKPITRDLAYQVIEKTAESLQTGYVCLVSSRPVSNLSLRP
jgi:diguanylate cyclase (GGDEF)-like protein